MASLETSPPAAVATARARRHRRRRALTQFARFAVVGASGYAVNLAVFAAAHAAGAHYRIAATVAFLAAVAWNFAGNRRWTFAGHDGRASHQAARFLTVSVVAFLLGLGVLSVLVAAGLPELLAQAISIVAVTPVSFAGNRLWTFRTAPQAAPAPDRRT
jgi:putative flippase GtrA